MSARRSFVDADGEGWAVYELPAPAREPSFDLGVPDRRAPVLLCFESSRIRKGTRSYPRAWMQVPEEELASLCRQAREMV